MKTGRVINSNCDQMNNPKLKDCKECQDKCWIYEYYLRTGVLTIAKTNKLNKGNII
jgi:hypothetical protein